MNQADTAWMLISTALVLLMTPALAFFYGGLVRAKNVLNVLMQCFLSAGIVGVLWILVGYSLAFGTGNAFIGDISQRPWVMVGTAVLVGYVLGAGGRSSSTVNPVAVGSVGVNTDHLTTDNPTGNPFISPSGAAAKPTSTPSPTRIIESTGSPSRRSS